jgi:hypothetical protein
VPLAASMRLVACSDPADKVDESEDATEGIS